MSTRIPPSLAWLINKRARLAGKIRKSSKLIEHLRKIERESDRWQADLVAIDRTLAMHDIQIDTDCIRPIAPRKASRIKLPYGGLTRALLGFLRTSDTPLSTDELTMMLIDHSLNVIADPTDHYAIELIFRELRTSVYNRLKNLVSNGLIVKSSGQKKGQTTYWTLPKYDSHK